MFIIIAIIIVAIVVFGSLHTPKKDEIRPLTEDEVIERNETRAQQGDVEAMYTLGLFYFDRNLSSSHYWYRKAAENGHLEAMYEIAKCCEEGVFWHDMSRTLRNMEAAKWYKEIAYRCSKEYGDGSVNSHALYAMRYLAQSYEHGIFLEDKKDLEKALYWYEMAKNNGNYSAIEDIERVKKAMQQR